MIGSAITLFSEYHGKLLSKQLRYLVVSDEYVVTADREREREREKTSVSKSLQYG